MLGLVPWAASSACLPRRLDVCVRVPDVKLAIHDVSAFSVDCGSQIPLYLIGGFGLSRKLFYDRSIFYVLLFQN